jgi:hypothetical protein
MTNSDILALFMPIFATGAVLLTGVAVVYQATHRKLDRKRGPKLDYARSVQGAATPDATEIALAAIREAISDTESRDHAANALGEALTQSSHKSEETPAASAAREYRETLFARPPLGPPAAASGALALKYFEARIDEAAMSRKVGEINVGGGVLTEEQVRTILERTQHELLEFEAKILAEALRLRWPFTSRLLREPVAPAPAPRVK